MIPDRDLIKTLRDRAGAAYTVGDYTRASRLRAAADLLEGLSHDPDHPHR